MCEQEIIEFLKLQVESAEKFIIEHNKKESMLGAVLNNRARHYSEEVKSYLKNTPIPRNGYSVTLGIFNAINGIKEYPKCCICGKEVHRFKNILEGWYSTCCKECSMLEKYGVTNTSKLQEFKDKFVTTIKQKYGGMGYSSKELRQKSIETIKKKYGEDYRQKFNEKAKQTQLERYGAEHIMQTEEGVKKYLASRVYDEAFINRMRECYTPEKIEKIARSRRNNYLKSLREVLKGKFDILISEDQYKGFRNRIINKAIKYQIKCLKCNTIFEAAFTSGSREDGFICPGCKDGSKSYIQHRFIENLRETYSNLHFQEDRIGILASRKELDIYCVEKKLAIEYNGNCWHSEKFNNFDKNRHINKYKETINANIDFLAFWSDEYVRNRFRIYGMIDMLLLDRCIVKYRKYSFERLNINLNDIFVFCNKAIQINSNDKIIGYVYINDKTLVDFYLMENISKNSFNQILKELKIESYKLENRFKSYYKRWINLDGCIDLKQQYHIYDKGIRSIIVSNKENNDVDKIWNYGYVYGTI